MSLNPVQFGTEVIDQFRRYLMTTFPIADPEMEKQVRQNLRHEVGGERIIAKGPRDIPEYPPVAMREALINTIAHTDYSLRGMQIMLAIYSNRLELQNPGTPPFGMTLKDLENGISRIRNPVIARVLRELEHMETWGSGYKRIKEYCLLDKKLLEMTIPEKPNSPKQKYRTTKAGRQVLNRDI